MIDARLHPADVVAHDEEDVGLRLLLLRGRGRGHKHYSGEQSEPDIPANSHGPFPPFVRLACLMPAVRSDRTEHKRTASH